MPNRNKSELVAKSVVGFDGYFARSDGRILSTVSGDLVMLSNVDGPYGYLRVSARVNGRQVFILAHRMVALAFHKNRSGPGAYVDHIDGDRKNNAASNLRWVTPKENSMYAVRDRFNGKHWNSGSGNPSAKLTEDDALSIYEMTKAGVPHRDIAMRFGVGVSVVGNISSGVTWSFITGAIRRSRRNNSCL